MNPRDSGEPGGRTRFGGHRGPRSGSPSGAGDGIRGPAGERIPYLGERYFVNEIPASDNVSFITFLRSISKTVANK